MDTQISAILGLDPEPFETLISNLMTPSNKQRSEAESLFMNLCKQTDPNTIVKKLVHLLKHSPHLEARLMSAIMLRNVFQQTDTVTSSITDPNTFVQDELPLWNSLLESTRSLVKSVLLNCVVKEQNKPIIKILGHAISELAADNAWPELMPFMLDLVESEDSSLQESALLIFAQLAQYVGGSLWSHIMNLHSVFMKRLGNVGSADVRIAALIAAINFIRCLYSWIDWDRFRDLLPGMMQCLTEALNNENDAMVQKVLVLLIELAGTVPRFFRGQLVDVIESMLQIAEAENLEEGTRHLAIEFVITLVEEIFDLPQSISSRLFAILMRMLDIEDDADWNSAENEDEDAGESSNYSIGKECLHRLATAFGWDIIVREAYDHLYAYLAVPEWQKNLAALVALAQIDKRLSMVNGGLVYKVITMVMNAFQNPRHPRVRWAAIHAIGKLATHAGPSWQDFFKNRVLTTLCLAQDDIRNPRIQETKNNFDQLLDLFQDSHHPYVRVVAINAICQFSINLDPKTQFQYHSRVLPALAEAINKDLDPLVRVAAINATCKLPTDLDPNLQLLYIPALAEAINKDLDPLVRVAAINAACKLPTDLDPNLQLLYISALAEAINKDLDSRVRLAVISATCQLSTIDPNLLFQYYSSVLRAQAEAINKDPDPSVRVAAIEGICRLPTDLDPDLLWQYIAALAEAIYEDLDKYVRLAAINAAWKLSTNLDPNSQFQHHSHVLPALAAAIYEDPNTHVRLKAINATIRLSTDLDPDLPLPDLYDSYVLPALHVAICDFEYLVVQDHAFDAMIKISKNYPLDTPRYLRVTVGTLLELRRREDIASDQTRIDAIRNILKAFEGELPHDTWTSTFNRLRPDQQAEFRSILEHEIQQVYDWFEDDSEDDFEDDSEDDFEDDSEDDFEDDSEDYDW